MEFERKSKLPRLAPEFYRDRAIVFWTHTVEARATGWLDAPFHGGFRELLIHTCARYGLACPLYVIMPDHWHLLWMGLGGASDQLKATAFLRKYIAGILAPACLQDRPHDHVLRDRERERGAFMEVSQYIRDNPERAGLVAPGERWPYLGAVVPGYPDLDPYREDFWPDFWKIHERLLRKDWRGKVPPPCAAAVSLASTMERK